MWLILSFLSISLEGLNYREPIYQIYCGHRRSKLTTLKNPVVTLAFQSARMVLFPASGVMLQRLFTKACMGCKRFFLKARKNQLKNVMFLNKIDLPYCLVVFFVVCSRLRPFWSVFGELPRRYFGVPLLREIQGRTVINFLGVRRSRRIIPLEHYPRPQFLQNFKAEKLQFHVHSLYSQFLNGSLEESSSKCGSRSSKR